MNTSEPTHAALDGGGLRVTFPWQVDRSGHRVEYLGDGELQAAVALFESVEGTADQIWPASPALKQLHVEQHDGVQVALLVGMAGRSHWSLSISLDPAARRIVFDAACRVREAPLWLGSRYTLLAAAHAGSQPAVRSEWLAARTHSELLFDAGARLRVEPIGDGAAGMISATDEQFTISAASGRTDGSWPQTVRWRYVLTADPKDVTA